MTLSPRIARAAFSAALVLLGVAAAIGGWGYGVAQENGQIGAGFLPLVLGIVVALLAAVDTATILLRREPSHTAEQLTGVEDEANAAAIDTVEEASDIDALGRTGKQRNRMLAIVAGMLIVALLLVPVLGLLLSLGALMIAIAIVVERRPIVSSIIVSVIAVGVIHLVFSVLLRVPMPTGLLGLI
ncbi:MAG: tripartite tricarboxylate transporter TctB family protein [Actinomycetota bacterium]